MVHMEPCSNKYVGLLLLLSKLVGILNSISNDTISFVRDIDSIDSLKYACHIFLLLVDQVINVAILRRLRSNQSALSFLQPVLNGFSSLKSRFAFKLCITTLITARLQLVLVEEADQPALSRLKRQL